MVWGGMWRAVRLLAGFLAAGCSPLAAINGAVETEGLTISRAIAYGAGPRQALDVYRHAAAGAGPAPVVVFFYGGAWEYGDRGDYLFAAQALAERGFVTVVPDYRLYPAARFPAFVEDGAAAVRWVHDNIGAYGGDPGRIALMGHSAGAYIAAMLALDERYLERRGLGPAALRGAVGVAGPYDFLPFSSDRLREIFAAATPPEQSMPINFVDGTEPPLLLIHSLSDTTVYPKNAQNLAARIRDRGGRVELVEYEKVNHAVLIGAMGWPLRGIAPTLADSTAFLRRVLDPAAAAPADQPAVRSAVSP